MIPEVLKIKGFLSYRNEAVLDFTQVGDVVLITGDNGHGKSSIIDALVYAFFGVARGITRNKGDIVNIDEKELLVELTFREKGKRYRIKRTYRKDKESSSLILEEFDSNALMFKNISEGKITDTEQKIQKILGFNYDTFIGASFILQGQADFFTTKTPSEKAELLREMLGLEIFESAKEIAKERKKELLKEIDLTRKEIEEKRGIIEKDSEYNEQYRIINDEISALEKRIKDVSDNLDNIQKLKGELIKLNERFESVKREKEAYEKRLKENLLNLEDLKKTLNEFTEILKEKDEIISNYNTLKDVRLKREKESEKELVFINLKNEKVSKEKEIKAKEEAKLKEIALHKKSLEEVQNEIEYTGKKIEKYIEEIEKLSEEKHQILEIKDKLSNEVLELEKRQSELLLKEERLKNILEQKNSIEKNIENNLNRLKKELGELTKKKENIKNLKKDFEEALKSKEEERVLLSKEIENLKGIALQKDLVVNEIENTLKEISALEKAYELEKEKENLITTTEEPKCPLCGSPLTEEHRDKLLKDFKTNIENFLKSIEQLKVKREELSKKLNTILESEKHLQEKLILHGKLEETLSNISNKISQEEVEIKDIENRILEIESEIKKEENNIDLEKINSDIETLKKEIEEKAILESEFTKKKKELEETETKLKKIDDTLLELVANRKNEETNLEKSLTKQREENSTLETLQKEFESKTFIENELKELKEIEDKLFALNFDEANYKKLKEEEFSLRIYEEKYQKLTVADVKIENIQAQIKKLESEIEELKKEIALKENDLAELATKIKNLSYVEDEFKKTSKELDDLNSTLREKYITKAKLEENLNLISKIKEEIKEKTTIVIELEERVNALNALEEILGRNGVQLAIMSEYLPHLENEVNSFLQRLTDGGMYLKFQTVKSDKNSEKPTLDILIYDRGTERRYELFSGGEKFRIDFSLRLGIAKFLAHIRNATLEMLVIDEGFGSQDARGRTNILEEINAIKSDFKKILVISHLNEIKENFTNQIRVVKDENGSRIEVP
ncbi:MAG: SMC family ATPase [Caldisericum sp.]|jgi:exonuclease SbcC|nr:SMC family ATPase [Caldisericum sp.]